MTSLQAFQAQQAMAQRLLAVSAVRNRRSAARQQQMMEINAEKAYRAGLSAEKAGRLYTALRRYERAAEVAPGSQQRDMPRMPSLVCRLVSGSAFSQPKTGI